jgi:hypothetical protein
MAEGQQQSAAAAAAERVRAIVEAAEQGAAELERATREEAERIRAGARRDAARAREIVESLEERADELEGLLDELAHAVQASVATLKRELDGLQEAAAVSGAPPASDQPPVAEHLIAEAESAAARTPDVGPVEREGAEPLEVAGADPEAAEPPAVAAAEPGEPEEPEATPGLSAPEGARVLALQMALDGIPREETARYLHENFALEDPEGLLDEVYAKAGL